MTRTAPHDDLVLYNTWVAHSRNASAAARYLGMETATMQYHVRTKDFQQKYLMEYGGLAEGTMKAGIVSAMLAIPDAISALVDIIQTSHMVTDPETGLINANAALMKAKVNAVEALVKYIPVIPEKLEDLDQGSTIEVSGTYATPSYQLSPEDEIKLQLESNIIDTAEKRSRPRR